MAYLKEIPLPFNSVFSDKIKKRVTPVSHWSPLTEHKMYTQPHTKTLQIERRTTRTFQQFLAAFGDICIILMINMTQDSVKNF